MSSSCVLSWKLVSVHQSILPAHWNFEHGIHVKRPKMPPSCSNPVLIMASINHSHGPNTHTHARPFLYKKPTFSLWNETLVILLKWFSLSKRAAFLAFPFMNTGVEGNLNLLDRRKQQYNRRWNASALLADRGYRSKRPLVETKSKYGQ